MKLIAPFNQRNFTGALFITQSSPQYDARFALFASIPRSVERQTILIYFPIHHQCSRAFTELTDKKGFELKIDLNEWSNTKVLENQTELDFLEFSEKLTILFIQLILIAKHPFLSAKNILLKSPKQILLPLFVF